jgi:hypothetical protein
MEYWGKPLLTLFSVAATVRLRVLVWHNAEACAELRGWSYHKPQSPWLAGYRARLFG